MRVELRYKNKPEKSPGSRAAWKTAQVQAKKNLSKVHAPTRAFQNAYHAAWVAAGQSPDFPPGSVWDGKWSERAQQESLENARRMGVSITTGHPIS